MTTAFVLSGGGNLGAVQAGQVRALIEAGVRPDLVIGSSVGAINGAFVASSADEAGCRELCALWSNVRRTDVFPTPPLTGLGGFFGRRDHVISDSGLRTLLRRHLRFRDLEHAPIPLHVVTCELRSGEEVLLSSGDAIDAICASAAIPGVFPPVTIDGRVLVDGGVANNAPISHAIDLGADIVWVLPCGYACALPEAPKRVAGIVMQAISILVHQRLSVDVRRYHGTHDVRVLPTLCPLNVVPTDFRQSVRLMDEAYQAACAWLASGTPDLTGAQGFPHHH